MKKIINFIALTIISLAMLQLGSSQAQAPATSSQHLKKDGNVDHRYKSTKSTSYSTTARQETKSGAVAGTAVNQSNSSKVATNTASHTKADGTVDKRYKQIKTETSTNATSTTPNPTATGSAQATTASVKSSTASSVTTERHLKKDGTPDMRYKENRTKGVDKNGSADKRFRGNKN